MPIAALARSEHTKGLLLIDDELFKAHSALQSGQDTVYKARLQSAFVSLQMLMREEVGR